MGRKSKVRKRKKSVRVGRRGEKGKELKEGRALMDGR